MIETKAALVVEGDQPLTRRFWSCLVGQPCPQFEGARDLVQTVRLISRSRPQNDLVRQPQASKPIMTTSEYCKIYIQQRGLEGTPASTEVARLTPHVLILDRKRPNHSAGSLEISWLTLSTFFENTLIPNPEHELKKNSPGHEDAPPRRLACSHEMAPPSPHVAAHADVVEPPMPPPSRQDAACSLARIVPHPHPPPWARGNRLPKPPPCGDAASAGDVARPPMLLRNLAGVAGAAGGGGDPVLRLRIRLPIYRLAVRCVEKSGDWGVSRRS